jgi:hypothetical protein
MPLLDHFHPPLVTARHWESFHGRWAAALFDLLNDHLLPEGYFAEMEVRLGTRIEVDVATLTNLPSTSATGPAGWVPPPPRAVVPLTFPESVEVLVHAGEGGPTLVAAIELVSPSNKDRPDTREAFVIKCAAYLQAGCGLILVDVVSSSTACLHNDLADLLGVPQMQLPAAPRLYVAAYHPRRQDEQEQMAVWTESLTIGATLPTMPLFVRGFGPLPIDLEATYHEACVRARLVPREPAPQTNQAH